MGQCTGEANSFHVPFFNQLQVQSTKAGNSAEALHDGATVQGTAFAEPLPQFSVVSLNDWLGS